MLRYLTSGESHGKCMLTILDGMPAGLKVDGSLVNEDLCRRMSGYGRGARTKDHDAAGDHGRAAQNGQEDGRQGTPAPPGSRRGSCPRCDG